jgi:DNA transformation protein
MADDSFKEFVLDQLSALPDVRAKAMFGAHGLYSGESFFAILDEGRLFFKTDAQSQADYTARGMGPFTYEMKGRVMTMSYHEVPPDVLENAPELVAWARRAIQIAFDLQGCGFGPRRKKDPGLARHASQEVLHHAGKAAAVQSSGGNAVDRHLIAREDGDAE